MDNIASGNHPYFSYFDPFFHKIIGKPFEGDHDSHTTGHSSPFAFLKKNDGFLGMVKLFVKAGFAGGVLCVYHTEVFRPNYTFIEAKNYEQMQYSKQITSGRYSQKLLKTFIPAFFITGSFVLAFKLYMDKIKPLFRDPKCLTYMYGAPGLFFFVFGYGINPQLPLLNFIFGAFIGGIMSHFSHSTTRSLSDRYEFTFGTKTPEEREKQKMKDYIEFLGSQPEVLRNKNYVPV